MAVRQQNLTFETTFILYEKPKSNVWDSGTK